MSTPPKPIMRHCPDCQAPNPPRLDAYFACGASLNVPSAPPLGADAPTCAGCGARFAAGATICPHCGRVAEPAPLPAPSLLTAPVAVPDNWSIEPLPGGGMCLWQTGGIRIVNLSSMDRAGGCLGIAALAGVFLYAAPEHVRGLPVLSHGGTLDLGIIILLAIAAAGIIAVLLPLHSEIRAGHGWLAVRDGCGNSVHTRRIEGVAVLKVVTKNVRDDNESYQERFLEAQNLGQHMRLSAARRETGIPGGRDEPALLGEALAQTTGWQCIYPASGKF